MLKAGLQNKPDERPGHLTMARAGGPSLFAINGNNYRNFLNFTVRQHRLSLPSAYLHTLCNTKVHDELPGRAQRPVLQRQGRLRGPQHLRLWCSVAGVDRGGRHGVWQPVVQRLRPGRAGAVGDDLVRGPRPTALANVVLLP